MERAHEDIQGAREQGKENTFHSQEFQETEVGLLQQLEAFKFLGDQDIFIDIGLQVSVTRFQEPWLILF